MRVRGSQKSFHAKSTESKLLVGVNLPTVMSLHVQIFKLQVVLSEFTTKGKSLKLTMGQLHCT